MSASPYQLKSDPYSSHALILRTLGEGQGRRALDVGAADGFLSELLTRQGWQVTALERDPAQAAKARGRCHEVIVADLDAAAPKLSGAFDAIVYGDVLEHLTDPLPVLVAINRSLASDGRVVVSVPNVAHLWVRLQLLPGRWDYGDRGILDRTHLRLSPRRTSVGCRADARTRTRTHEELPKESVNLVILVDDGARDQTREIARELGLEIFVHDKNYGYGANQKTCYTEALKAGADIVVMVHPDYQYDPTLVPKMIEPIVKGEADLVLGSRLKGGGSAIAQGMPWWEYISSRFLTGVENVRFGLHLSEYPTGHRAFNREALEAVNFRINSDGFVFDQEIIAQALSACMRIRE